LRSFNVEVENLVIHRLNFEEMVISSIKKTNHTHLHKCIQYDQKLLALYDEALALKPNTSGIKAQRNKISDAVLESTYFLENAGFILES
jgi:hypothetical protein